MGNVLTRDEALERSAVLRDVRYEIDLDLTNDTKTFGSRTTVRFACSAPGSSTFIDLTAPELLHAELNGTAIALDAFDGDRLQVDGLAGDNVLVVHARAAYQNTGAGLSRFVDPVDERVYLHTQFEPFDAHRVFACFDQPDLKADVIMSVLAPADWVVASNGAESSVEEGAARRWSFAPLPRMSTYLVALVAGPYHVVREQHGDIPLGIYCRQSLAEHLEADDIFGLTKQGLDYFAPLFDSPYPWGKYDQLFVPEFRSGAMENPGCVVFHEGFIFRSAVTESMREGRAGVILHEMAHMWFGDLVTMRWWDDLWLNESFATYMASRAAVEATRFTEGWTRFASGTKSGAYFQDQLPTTHPIAADITDTDALRLHFDGITYSKGASVLRQLAAWVGQDAFDEGLRGYFRDHAFDNADLSDFLTALEKSSGRELVSWSREWLQTAGVNTLAVDLTSEDGTITGCAVRQYATDPDHATLRSHRIRIGCYVHELAAGLQQSDLVEIDVTGPRTYVPELVGRSLPELVVVNDGDLGYTKVSLDVRSLAALETHLGGIADPLTRGLCWSAAWEMVRDAELATRRFVDLVCRHVRSESDLSSAQRLLSLAAGAVAAYGDPAARPASRERLGGLAFELLSDAEAGSDAQVTWARMWVALVRSPEFLAKARDLLDGTWQPAGLAVDVDLRWSLVTVLCVRGGAPTSLIEEELARDATDMGERRAAALRAAVPDFAAKEHAWRAASDDLSLSLALRRGMAGSIFQMDQDELVAPFVDRYFAALPGIWADRELDEALMLTGNLYPMTIVTQDTISRTEAALADDDLPPVARRILLEASDGLRRQLKAQALDITEG